MSQARAEAEALEVLEWATGLKGADAVNWISRRLPEVSALARLDHYEGNVPRAGVSAFRQMSAARDVLSSQSVLFDQAIKAQEAFKRAQARRAEEQRKAAEEARRKREAELREQVAESARELLALEQGKA